MSPNSETQYSSRLATAKEAADSLRDRSNLILGLGVAMPPALMGAVADRASAGGFSELKLYYMHSSPAAAETLLKPELMDVIKPHSLFMSAFDRQLEEEGIKVGKSFVHFVPSTFHQAGRMLTEQISPDCFMVTVSSMDRHGYFSLGTSPDYGAEVARKAKRVIVEVNPNMPRTFGECLVHVSDVDMIIEHEAPLMQVPHRDPCWEDQQIGRFIAEHIDDGATLQLGVGGVPTAVAQQLGNHKDLGLHSELFSPAIADLIKKGVMNGRRKTLMPHKHVYTVALGDTAVYDFMNDNPSVVGYPVSWVNNPSVIRKNEDMISVNAAIEVDLTGQVNSEHLAGRQFSGAGGQLDFVRGAYASKGGKSFIALHSTAKKGAVTRIVPTLHDNVLTDPRMDTHFIATEFGVTDLKGRSIPERARALINLAHPNFQSELEKAAFEMGLLA